jgi:FAD/FMN-containing dehydrogenase
MRDVSLANGHIYHMLPWRFALRIFEDRRIVSPDTPQLLAIGGYGLFGVITRMRLRLIRRLKLERW